MLEKRTGWIAELHLCERWDSETKGSDQCKAERPAADVQFALMLWILSLRWRQELIETQLHDRRICRKPYLLSGKNDMSGQLLGAKCFLLTSSSCPNSSLCAAVREISTRAGRFSEQRSRGTSTAECVHGNLWHVLTTIPRNRESSIRIHRPNSGHSKSSAMKVGITKGELGWMPLL